MTRESIFIGGARAAGILVVLSLGLGGCASGHGKYTGEFKEQAENRIAQIKAGTSWDLAQQQFLSGDLQKALDNVEHSIALSAEVAKSHLLRGRILLEMERLETAIGAFENAIVLDEQDPEAFYYLGIVHERFSDPETAFGFYNQASDADTTNPQFALAAAETLIELDRLDDARELIMRKQSAFEHNAGIRQTLGHIAQMKDEDSVAVQYFHEAHLLAPDDLNILEDLAWAQLDSAMYSEAEMTLRRLIDGSDEIVRRDLMHMRIRCLLELDRPVDARAILHELTRVNEGDGDVRAWVTLGQVATILENQHEIREAANRVIALAPRRFEGHFLMGMWARRDGDLDRAIRSLSEAARLSETDPSPAVLLGLTYRDLGDEAKASQVLAYARTLSPDDERLQHLTTQIATVPIED